MPTMTPCDLEVLLHYHYSNERHPRHDAPAICASRNKFITADILTNKAFFGDAGFTTTERGKALVTLLCNTQFPTKVSIWIDEHGNKIIEK